VPLIVLVTDIDQSPLVALEIYSASVNKIMIIFAHLKFED